VPRHPVRIDRRCPDCPQHRWSADLDDARDGGVGPRQSRGRDPRTWQGRRDRRHGQGDPGVQGQHGRHRTSAPRAEPSSRRGRRRAARPIWSGSPISSSRRSGEIVDTVSSASSELEASAGTLTTTASRAQDLSTEGRQRLSGGFGQRAGGCVRHRRALLLGQRYRPPGAGIRPALPARP